MSEDKARGTLASDFGEVRIASRPLAAPLPTEEEVLVLRSKNLHYVVAHGHSEDARRIIFERHGDEVSRRELVNAPLDEGGETLLHVAADGGFLDTVRMLLELGAEVDKKECITDRTPLAYSIAQGHWELAAILINAGANVEGLQEELGMLAPVDLLKKPGLPSQT